MSLTHEDVRQILAMLDQSDCEEVHLEYGDLKLHLRRLAGESGLSAAQETASCAEPIPPAMASQGAPAPTQSRPGRQGGEDRIPDGLVAVTAPMLGVFYRAPSPGEKPFVEVGDRVAPDDTVCLLEVMKLFSSVKAGTAGTIEKVLVDNAALVEYGQRLMLIRSDSAGAATSDP